MDLGIVGTNFLYASGGILLTLFAMAVGYFLFNLITPFDTAKELAEKNTAVGIVVGSLFIGLGLAIGLVVGMGLN